MGDWSDRTRGEDGGSRDSLQTSCSRCRMVRRTALSSNTLVWNWCSSLVQRTLHSAIPDPGIIQSPLSPSMLTSVVIVIVVLGDIN